MENSFCWCIAFTIDEDALESLLREGEMGGYRDPEPWWVAADLFADAQAAGQRFMALLIGARSQRVLRWAEVREIEVHALASRRETRVRFSRSEEMNPIFAELDAITLRPAEHVLERERREDLRPRRLHLDASWLSSYAICETPACLNPAAPN